MTRKPVNDRGDDARLVELTVADRPSAWAAAGFRVDSGSSAGTGPGEVRLGATTIRLTASEAPGSQLDTGATTTDHQADQASPASRAERGITSWTISGLNPIEQGDNAGQGTTALLVDGLPTHLCASSVGDSTTAMSQTSEPGPTTGPSHPNGALQLDHVVVQTPDLERTIEAFAPLGLEVRRIRETTSHGTPMRQAFIRLGPTILEIVSGDTGSGQPATEAPARWFGLAIDVDDLDSTGAELGDGLGSTRAAVQPGRRIATLRNKSFGISMPIAFMDDRGDDAADARTDPGQTGRYRAGRDGTDQNQAGRRRAGTAGGVG